MTPTSDQIDAPIVAVTVYPDRARVTRRGTVALPAGQHRVRIGPLPLDLHRDSIRVGGTGPATVLGVDVVTHHHDRSPDSAVAELEEQRWTVTVELTELADADAVERQRAEFLATLAQRSGGTYARALAAGDATPADVGAFADSVADQLAESRARQRELTHRRRLAEERLAAIERQLATLTGRQRPDRLAAEVTLAVGAADADAAEVQLELSYVVNGAGWRSSYDLRLVEETLTLTWFGLITQRTGEDWPECELQLSTARPSAAANVPELDPWYLDRFRPTPPPPPRQSFGAMQPLAMPVEPGGAPAPAPAPAAAAPARARMKESVATVEQGVAAATYRPARPVAVPADGSAHRATVAVLEMPTKLDYLTAPVRAEEAHLRATVVNGSTHTLPAGPASVFHGGDFVAATKLPRWAPGEEVELALGLDDRVRVERVLARRSDTKATLGSTRRREVEYRITVANHTPRAAAVTVLDQLPVSRDEGVVVRELRLEPSPTERADLGRLSWRLQLAPGESREIHVGLRVELAKGVELVGWRE
ncbi:DUF4139 domain-containing protein [Micromonospora polyrhachis]|uniref:Uncharacterized protein (TIGR02231 family) n=1 Tax=Micromonospora polyrhachis TaxID=1282883 RepID=A0A7W7STY2_9ACTN|nr:mucoidy inhibitor MuiA family protein [Micromonospora polyrhachis]MBB4960913.1 uncharacterized protein (TIGR02231 family) [Micromonospora polyrhachis]